MKVIRWFEKKLSCNSKGQLIFEMSFWCHCFAQNSNENIVRISALKFFVAFWKLFWASYRLSHLSYYLLSSQEAQESFQEAPRKLQKIHHCNKNIMRSQKNWLLYQITFWSFQQWSIFIDLPFSIVEFVLMVTFTNEFKVDLVPRRGIHIRYDHLDKGTHGSSFPKSR